MDVSLRTEPPLLFSRQRQRIFAFIWDNPNCTRTDIIEEFYPRNLYASETVSVHLSMIKAGLGEATEYQLTTRRSAKYRNAVGRALNEYKVTKRIKCPPQLPDYPTPTAKAS